MIQFTPLIMEGVGLVTKLIRAGIEAKQLSEKEFNEIKAVIEKEFNPDNFPTWDQLGESDE